MSIKKITKNDLIDGIYKKTYNLERQDILDIVDSMLEEVKHALESGAKIELRGFGTFEPRLRKGKSCARNPKNGELVSVKPHYVAVFRSGQDLKQKLWNLPVDPDDTDE